MNIVLSNSLRNLATGCKKKVWFQEVERLVPEMKVSALRLGSLWHSFVEGELLQRDPTDKHLAMEKTLQNEDPETFTLYQGMVKGFREHFPSVIRDYEVVCTEKTFCLHITRSPRGFSIKLIPEMPKELPESRGVHLYYTGVIDALVRIRGTNRIWVMEHKTTSHGQTSFVKAMEKSFQIYGYMQAAKLLYPEDDIVGVWYNAARKKVPGVPQANQCKPCKGTGFMDIKTKIPEINKTVATPSMCTLCEGTGKGELSKRKMETTRSAITQAIQNNPQLQKAEYSEFLVQFQVWAEEQIQISAPYFHEYYRPVSEEQVIEWMKDTWAVARAYGKLLKAKTQEFTRSLDATGCGWCPYSILCFDDSPELRSFYTIRGESLLPHEVAMLEDPINELAEELGW